MFGLLPPSHWPRSSPLVVLYTCTNFYEDPVCGNGTCGCCLLKELCLLPACRIGRSSTGHKQDAVAHVNGRYSIVYTSLGIAVGGTGVYLIHHDRATLLNFQIYLTTFASFLLMNTCGTIVHSVSRCLHGAQLCGNQSVAGLISRAWIGLRSL
eukprot:scaffold323_cov414-Prasinococcus_capsulatus_cf.AAC.55